MITCVKKAFIHLIHANLYLVALLPCRSAKPVMCVARSHDAALQTAFWTREDSTTDIRRGTTRILQGPQEEARGSSSSQDQLPTHFIVHK